MDFQVYHKSGTGVVLADLKSDQEQLKRMVNAGMAMETTYKVCSDNYSKSFMIDGSRILYEDVCELILAARDVRFNSYAPYSHFNVGASILASDHYLGMGIRKISSGCNVENAAYGSTICAERSAALSAVSQGYRSFLAVAIVGGFDASINEDIRKKAQENYITPCGGCRQVMAEFMRGNTIIIMAKDTGEVLITTLSCLLPCSFGPHSLGASAADYSTGFYSREIFLNE